MRHGIRSILPLSVLLTAVVMAVMLIGTALTGITIHAADDANAIVSANLTKDLASLEVKVTLNSDTLAQNYDGIYLFEIMPYQSASQIGQLTPLAQEKPAQSMTFKVNFDIKNRPRLFAKLVVAVKAEGGYTIIAPARYIDNVDAAAESTFEYPKAISKKGLQIQMLADAQELGVSNTIINIPVNEYLHAEKKANSTAYVFYNQTYYFDSDMIAYLDHRIKVLTEANINVYLDIVLTAPQADLDLKLRSLYYDNVSDMAEFYAFNMQNQDSVMYLEAFLTFLAERYTREDAQYGFAGSFIMGYEVNSNRNSNSMGSQNMDSYLNSYIAAFRIADTALRSVYSNGRVYVSLANNFSREAGADQISTDPLVDYAAKSFLDAFNEKVKYAGNIPWRVAINPYSSDPANSSFWNDGLAADTTDTPYLTMKNIDVLTDYLKLDNFLYNGETRSVLISEFGVSADPDSSGVSTQAAGIVYSYYKAVANPHIEAIIYHRHVDHDTEAQAGLWYGLWTHTAGSEVTPLAKKTAYNVFKYMDTTENSDVSAFALTMFGVDNWSKLINGFTETMASKRVIIETVPTLTDEVGRGYDDRLLCEFSDGDLFNFYPSDNTSVVELRADTVSGDSMMYAAAICENTREYMGVSSVYTTPLNVKSSKYITLQLKGEAPGDVDTLSVMLRLYSDSGVTYEGIGQITEGKWTSLTFDISKFTELSDTLDGLKLWIRPYDGSSSYVGEYALWLDTVTLLEKGGFTFGGFLAVVGIIILLGGAAIFVFLYTRNRAATEKQRKALEQRRNYAGQPSPNAPQRPVRPQGASPQQNRLGTLSSDEEFRAAYGDNRRSVQQMQDARMQQNTQQIQRPMQQRPMNNGQPMPQQRPVNNGQPMQNPQYRQPMPQNRPAQAPMSQRPMQQGQQIPMQQAAHRQMPGQANTRQPVQRPTSGMQQYQPRPQAPQQGQATTQFRPVNPNNAQQNAGGDQPTTQFNPVNRPNNGGGN